jgi:peptidoglycan/xylan/chitin deacetylase (PgdA/CDA1 family)
MHVRVLATAPVLIAATLVLACNGHDSGADGVEPEPQPENNVQPPLPSQAELAPLFGKDAVPGTVVVSLSFDDGFASQTRFFELLQQHDISSVRGTFYLNSSHLNLEQNEREVRDTPRYAPLETWLAAARDGHEIGSHSVSHLDLTCDEEAFALDRCVAGLPAIGEAERHRQVCGDKQMLRALGFDVQGFAYPFGRHTMNDADALHRLVAQCGFRYGRAVGELRRGLEQAVNGPIAETVPPRNAYAIRSYGSITRDVTFEGMKSWILGTSELGGGWVPLVFHHISDDCEDPQSPGQQLDVCVLDAELEKLLGWLAKQAEDEDSLIHTRTIGQVMAEVGQTQVLEVANGDLEQRHNASVARPDCFDRLEGKHEENFEWTEVDVEPEWDDAETGQALDASTQKRATHVEKLWPTEKSPTPIVQMTTRDDRCYLPVVSGNSYQVRVQARSFNAGKAAVEGQFVIRLLRLSVGDAGVDPVWMDWDLDIPTQTILGNWTTLHLNLPALPEGVVALAFGYQYVAPAPEADDIPELWLDDFAVVDYHLNHDP